MKCTDIEKYLDDYLDDVMSLGEHKAVEAHMKRCTSCQHMLKEATTLRQTLRSLPVEEVSPDFEEKIFEAARSHYNRHDNQASNRFIAGFSTAIAASLALWFASTIYTPQNTQAITQASNTAGSSSVISLAMSQSRMVKLVFDAPTDLSDVTLSVELPDNIELEGYTGRKQLAWQTSLSKGQNILTLPVIAIGNGQGTLVAQLNYGGKTKQFHLILKTDSDGAQVYQINPLPTV